MLTFTAKSCKFNQLVFTVGHEHYRKQRELMDYSQVVEKSKQVTARRTSLTSKLEVDKCETSDLTRHVSTGEINRR